MGKPFPLSYFLLFIYLLNYVKMRKWEGKGMYLSHWEALVGHATVCARYYQWRTNPRRNERLSVKFNLLNNNNNR
jgi:hypothetical protein